MTTVNFASAINSLNDSIAELVYIRDVVRHITDIGQLGDIQIAIVTLTAQRDVLQGLADGGDVW